MFVELIPINPDAPSVYVHVSAVVSIHDVPPKRGSEARPVSVHLSDGREFFAAGMRAPGAIPEDGARMLRDGLPAESARACAYVLTESGLSAEERAEQTASVRRQLYPADSYPPGEI